MILTKLGKFFQWSDKIRVKVTAKGERGKTGVSGLKGAKGILGDTGKPGEQGERGTDVSVLIMTSGGIFTCRLNRGRVVCAEW